MIQRKLFSYSGEMGAHSRKDITSPVGNAITRQTDSVNYGTPFLRKERPGTANNHQMPIAELKDNAHRDFIRVLGNAVKKRTGISLTPDDVKLFTLFAVQIVENQPTIISHELFKILLESSIAQSGISLTQEEASNLYKREIYVRLTERQKELIGLILEGLTNKEIAARLGTAEGTVKSHKNRIFEKLGFDDRNQLISILGSSENHTVEDFVSDHKFVERLQVRLCPRKEQIMKLIATEALHNNEIARRLKLSEETIKMYLMQVFELLGFDSRVEVILFYKKREEFKKVLERALEKLERGPQDQNKAQLRVEHRSS